MVVVAADLARRRQQRGLNYPESVAIITYEIMARARASFSDRKYSILSGFDSRAEAGRLLQVSGGLSEAVWYVRPDYKKSGAGGIRTLGTVLKPYNGLANHRLQPLGHSSYYFIINDLL
jgi:hypothetical protein